VRIRCSSGSKLFCGLDSQHAGLHYRGFFRGMRSAAQRLGSAFFRPSDRACFCGGQRPLRASGAGMVPSPDAAASARAARAPFRGSRVGRSRKAAAPAAPPLALFTLRRSAQVRSRPLHRVGCGLGEVPCTPIGITVHRSPPPWHVVPLAAAPVRPTLYRRAHRQKQKTSGWRNSPGP